MTCSSSCTGYPEKLSGLGYWLVFVNLTQTGVSWEEGILCEELSPSDWSMGIFVGHFFWINDRYWNTHSIMGSATPGKWS